MINRSVKPITAWGAIVGLGLITPLGATTSSLLPEPDFGILKFQEFIQDAGGVTPIDNPFQFDILVDANVNLSSPVRSIGVVLPGTTSEVFFDPLSMGEDISFSESFPFFTSSDGTPALRDSYPSGTYQVNFYSGTTGDGTLLDTKSFDLSADDDGDIPSVAPRVGSVNGLTIGDDIVFSSGTFNFGFGPENIDFLDGIDPVQNNIFSLSTSSGLTSSGNFVALFVYDPVADIDVFNNIQAGDATDLEIFSEVLQPGQIYEVGVSFVNATNDPSTDLFNMDPTSFAISGFSSETFFYIQTIPEPETYALMGIGVAMVLVYLRRRS